MKTKLYIRTLIAWSLVAVFATAGCAQQSTNITPSVERLRKDVTYLASDKLEGRRTGTAGATAAAEYIADEFARLGLKPGNPGKAEAQKNQEPD